MARVANRIRRSGFGDVGADLRRATFLGSFIAASMLLARGAPRWAGVDETDRERYKQRELICGSIIATSHVVSVLERTSQNVTRMRLR